MRIETSTYRFDASERFSGRLIEFEGGSIWDAEAPRDVQVPILNFALSEIVDLTEEYGDGDYDQAVRSYFDIKRAGVEAFEDREEDIAGRRALVRTSSSKRETPGGPREVFHLFVNIPLDDEFMQEFSADCPAEVRMVYEPLFWAAIRSVEWTGDRRTYIDIQEAARTEQYARIDALTERLESLGQGNVVEDELAALEVPTFEPTPDSKPRVSIAGLEGALDGEGTRWTVAKLTRELLIEIAADFATAGADPAAAWLDSYRGGAVKFSVGLTGVYRGDGVPSGVYAFEQGRCQQPHLTVRWEGLDYGLDFTGEVTLREGWVGVIGTLGRSYGGDPPVPVDLRVSLDPELLDWSLFLFTSQRELAVASPQVLRHVALRGDIGDTFPETLLRAAQLRTLSLWMPPSSTGSPVGSSVELPSGWPACSPLLSELHVANVTLKTTLDLRSVRELEKLHLLNTGLVSFPQGVLQLPKLRFVGLSGNRLMSWPAEPVDLPCLESLDLSGNRLRTLPQALVEQPKLRRLQLEDNPWEFLPDRCNELEISLDIRDKRRLLDFEYRGADSEGVVAWKEESFEARADTELAVSLDGLLQAPALAPHRKALRFLAKHSVTLRQERPDDDAELGAHRAGGFPDLPKTWAYPRFGENWREGKADYAYEFLAQLNLTELAPLQDYLPRKGMLYFFLTTFHDLYGGNASPAKVLYYAGEVHADALSSGRDLGLEEEDYDEMTGSCYQPFRLAAGSAISLPSFYSLSQNPHLARGEASSLMEDEEVLDEGLLEEIEEPLRRLYPHDHEVGGYGFSQHEHPEAQAALALRGAPEDWMILLKLSSAGQFQWGDAGDLFFVIHKSDLAKGDFSNVFCTLESS